MGTECKREDGQLCVYFGLKQSCSSLSKAEDKKRQDLAVN